MADTMHNPNDPRWGQEGRETKAEAILKTMQIHTGQDLTDAVWLDIGCGSGGIAATLAAHVKQVVAARTPVSIIAWLAPLAPAFVFVLTRPSVSVAGDE